MTREHSNRILFGILAGIVAAAIGLALFGERMAAFAVLGDIFLLALRMVVLPLVMASVVVGMTSLGDIRKAGPLGLRTVAYYLTTTMLAVGLGILLVVMIQPGAGIPVESLEVPTDLQASIAAKKSVTWSQVFLSFLDPNIFGAMAQGKVLPVIVFSLVLGGVLTTLGDVGKPVVAFFEGLNAAMMKIVGLILWLAPPGIFGLVAGTFGKVPTEEWGKILGSVGAYSGVVVGGLAIHGLVVLPVLLWTMTRRSPLATAGAFLPAILTAWSTASSSATLPLTIECARDRAGVDARTAGFVLPLGATINMDGTALYEAVAVIFIAQAFGVDLAPAQFLMVFLTATVISIGAAGIPQAGLFMMVVILQTVNLPSEGIALIFLVDWFLDRFRTAVNVWGDSVGAVCIDRYVAESP